MHVCMLPYSGPVTLTRVNQLLQMSDIIFYCIIQLSHLLCVFLKKVHRLFRYNLHYSVFFIITDEEQLEVGYE